MKLPHQTAPVNRLSPTTITQPYANPAANSVAASGIFCGACKGAIKGVGKAFLGEGCAAADVAFETACNLALDWIPGIGEGPSEAACIAGGVALGAACEAAGGTVTQGAIDAAAKKACGWAC